MLYNIRMGTTQVGNLFKKSILRNLDGRIREMRDDANGGWIIKNYQIVNHERWDELVKIEEDKKKAAQAQSLGVVPAPEILEQRSATPSKIQELETRMNEQDKKLDTIISLLKK